MVEALVLKATRREKLGTRAARKQRCGGVIPAVIYGHKTEPVHVQLNQHDLTLEVQHHHRLVVVELDGKKERLLIKELQRDYLSESIIHVDLTRVSMDERVKLNVEIELKGVPAGLADGGLLDQMLSDVELECLVTNIPEKIRLVVSQLKLGESLSAGDLELPEGAKLITEPETPVAMVRARTEAAEPEEEEAVVEVDSKEPEVIGAKEKEEQEDTK